MDNNKIKVLVVEDEDSIRKFTVINLERNGFSTYEANSGESALEIAAAYKPHIIVLDVMLPGIDGFEVCKRVRRDMTDIAVIMLTARTQDVDKITGLDLGADDYMVKPFNPGELIARINTILRRTKISNVQISTSIPFKNLLMDLDSQKFFKDEVEIELTPTEFAVLKLLMNNPGRALSRNELLNTVWGRNYFGDLKTLDVYVRRLREKIEDSPSQPKYIETVWGYGYRWQSI